MVEEEEEREGGGETSILKDRKEIRYALGTNTVPGQTRNIG